MSKLNRWAKSSGRLFLQGILLIIFVEVMLNLFSPIFTVGIQDSFEYDEETGYRLKKSIHLFQNTDYLAETKTNAQGLANFRESFKDYKKLVFAVGDSYTQGTGLAPDEAYPFVMAMTMNFKEYSFSHDFGVVNLGVDGFGTKQSLLRLKRFIHEIGSPAYILYLGCDNDYNDDLLFDSGYRHRHVVDGSPVWGQLVPLLKILNNLQFVKRTKLAFSEVRQKMVIKKQASSSEELSNVSTAEKVFPTILEIKKIADDAGSSLVLSWANISDSYDWIQRKAEISGIPYADWRREAENLSKTRRLPYYNAHSGGHYRYWVNYIIAKAFEKEILASEGKLTPLSSAKEVPKKL